MYEANACGLHYVSNNIWCFRIYRMKHCADLRHMCWRVHAHCLNLLFTNSNIHYNLVCGPFPPFPAAGNPFAPFLVLSRPFAPFRVLSRPFSPFRALSRPFAPFPRNVPGICNGCQEVFLSLSRSLSRSFPHSRADRAPSDRTSGLRCE